jgi:hypothetical protein
MGMKVSQLFLAAKIRVKKGAGNRLWKTKKKDKKIRVSFLYRTAQPRILAPFPAWGGWQELVV